MTIEDYPALYAASDRASKDAQGCYLALTGAQLGSMLLVGILSASKAVLDRSHFPQIHMVVLTMIASFLAISLFSMFILRRKRYEKLWFDGRAVAESVKTATWKYMMKVKPYHEAQPSAANALFINELEDIRAARPNLKGSLQPKDVTQKEITPKMGEIREMEYEQRIKFYFHERLLDQKIWYTNNLLKNSEASSRWFWIVSGVQCTALILAMIQIAQEPLFNSVAVLITVAATAIAWAQVKRYEELHEAYDLAAQELRYLEVLSGDLLEKDAPEYITQVEEAISREHTMWCARRSVLLQPGSR